MAWFDRGPGGKKDPENEPLSSAPPIDNAPAVAAPAVTTPAATMKPESSKQTIERVGPPPPPKPAVTPVASPVETGLVAYLYKGSRVSGQLMFQGPAKIDGSVEGEIQCQGILTIGESAEVRAKISSQVVVIRGKVEGNVTAKEKVELLSPARVVGNISTPKLLITDGATFDGDCFMGVGKQKGGVASSQAISADKAATAQAPAQQTDSPK